MIDFFVVLVPFLCFFFLVVRCVVLVMTILEKPFFIYFQVI